MPSAALNGATLSEILISLMVMSIGVVSLATLFPISVLRSIQASQLTNATIHRLNVEQLIEQFPRLVHDPDADWNLDEHILENPGGDNPPGDFVNEGRFIVDPLGATHVNHVNSSVPIDVRGFFGNNAGSRPPNADLPINRYHGGFDNLGLLQPPPQLPAPPYLRNPYVAYLTDSWQVAAKGSPTVTAGITTSITASGGADLSDAATALAGGLDVRVVLFSTNGRQSVIRNLAVGDIAGSTINWTDSLGGATVSRFRLEIYEPRYSWLLTVRRSPVTGSADVDVVIFHKRAFTAASEQRFQVSNWTGTECTLNLNVAPAGTKPFLKKGGYLFDATNARWYRILQLKDETTLAPKITLDRPVIAPLNTTTNAIEFPKWAMAMPGIVEVFSIDRVPYNLNNPP